MGDKTKLQLRTALATDLKITIDTELSTAELNRSIERAYSDLSRFMPDEKIYEDSLQFAVADESVTFPKDTSLDAISADEDISGSTNGSSVALDGQPDVPRPLTVTLTDANNSMTGLVVLIKGADKDDQAIEEYFFYNGYGDSKTMVGKKYFKSVYSMVTTQLSGQAAGDVLDVGYGAYTDVWVYLANSPIKYNSDTGVGDDDVAIVKNTDYYIDYANGRVKAISGGLIATEEVCEFTYKKSQIGIDISGLPDLIRVQRVEYPVGDIPQTFITGDTFGNYFVATGSGESSEQMQWAEDKQFRVYYDTKHQVAGEYSPGTEPGFLTDTVLMAAGAYALYILALKQEHQVATDIASARTALGNATGTHSALALALADVQKYLNNNSNIDAVGKLAGITTSAADLRDAIVIAADAMNTYLDSVATELTDSSNVKPNYMGATANYLNGGAEPDVLAYLTSGDALLNTNTQGGEGTDVSLAYSAYARTVREALISVFERDRQFYQQSATTRTNAAMQYANEIAQRLSTLRSWIEEAAGYTAISNTFVAKAGHYLSQIISYIQQASQYVVASNSDIALADRFRAEADERRNEVYSVWRDRKQYIGDFTAGSMRQMPDYK